MEGAVVILVEALMFVSMLQWDFVGEAKEEESEGFSWDKVETGWFGNAGFDFVSMLQGTGSILHLFEPMYDYGVELVLVGEVFLKVGPKVKCFWAEGAMVTSGKSAKELMVSEVAG